MIKKILSIGKITAFVVLLALAGLSLLTLLPLRTPIKPYIVLSGSMQPAIYPGAIAFVLKTQDNFKIGDIITFIHPDQVTENVTHRIVRVEEVEGKVAYRTRGDANNSADQWMVRKDAIRGKALFSIPLLGFIVNFTRTRLGVVLVIVLPLVVIALDEIRVIYMELRRMKEEEKRKKEEGNRKQETISSKQKAESSKRSKHTFKEKKVALAIVLVAITNLAQASRQTMAAFGEPTLSSDQEISTTWWVVPTVSLLTPNGSQTLYQDNSYTITWTASSSDPAATVTVDLSYSTDGGATYPNSIAVGETNDGMYDWTVPSIFSSTVRVRVTATDSHALFASDDSDSDITIDSPIVLNEFLPNPTGNDADAMPGGEWVELYNNGTVTVDVNGWVLYDDDDTHELTISTGNSDNNGDTTDGGETTVSGGGFLVVYRNGDSDFALNNTGGDAVRLYNGTIGGGAALIDSYTYTLSPVPNDKSFARSPDGTGAFVDPDPTPGRSNILSTGAYAQLIEGCDTESQSCLYVEQSPSISVTPTAAPTAALTPEPTTTSSPESSPSATPSPEDFPTPTSEPSVSPTPESSPSATPTGDISLTPTVEPTLEPTAAPSIEATPIPLREDATEGQDPTPTSDTITDAVTPAPTVILEEVASPTPTLAP